VIGQNLLPALRRTGAVCRVLQHRRPVPGGDRAEIVRGDILDFQDGWLHGVDVVFHLAAQTLPPRDPTAMQRNNVEGTRCLVASILRMNRPIRLVYASSIAVFGPCRDGDPVDSRSPLVPVTAYGRTKRDAEALVRTVPGAVIVRFPMVLGPGDRVSGLFQRLARARLFPVPPRRFSAMDMRDAVRLLCFLAEAKDRKEDTYTVSDGAFYSWRDVAGAFSRRAGHRVWYVPLPRFVLRPALFRLAGNADGAHYLKHDWVCRPNFPSEFRPHHTAFERYRV